MWLLIDGTERVANRKNKYRRIPVAPVTFPRGVVDHDPLLLIVSCNNFPN